MKGINRRLIRLRRRIHQWPELGFQEHRTSHTVYSVLKGLGIRVKRGVGKTGVVGLLYGRPGRKCIALRADMDALPIQERTGKIYASRRPGIMHACGHDANTTILLGAAMLLSREKAKLQGTIKFIFQPSEETSGGARAMIRDGVLKAPKPDIIFGIHVNPQLETGKVGIYYGTMMASVDRFDLAIRGGGGHAASPHKGTDTIYIAGQVLTNIQSIVSRLVDPLEPVALSIGIIKGGTRFNVLAEEVRMQGTVRTLTDRVRKRIPFLLKKIVSGLCRMYGAECDIHYEEIGSSLNNYPRASDLVRKCSSVVVGRRNTVILQKPSLGGEDFAEFLEAIPGAFIYIGAGSKKRGVQAGWHHSKFDVDEGALMVGARILAEIAKKYLSI